MYMRELVPKWLLNSMTCRIFNSNVNHKGFGLTPRYSYAESSEVMVSDDLIPLIGNGRVHFIPEGIKQLTSRNVILTNGSVIDNVDTVICATGYRCDFSFVDERVFGGPTFRDTMLYQNMWPVDVYGVNWAGDGGNRLVVIGAVTTDGSVPTVLVSVEYKVTLDIENVMKS